MTDLVYTPKTIRKTRREWIKALRSDQFRKTTGTLKKYDSKAKKIKHCCLGVASELCGVASEKNHIDGEFLFYNVTADPDHYSFNETGGLPLAAQEWLGVEGEYPGINFPEDHEYYAESSMANLNDSGWSFKKIADALDKYGFEPNDDLLVK